MRVVIILFLIILTSCSESYYVQYSVSGTATEANIIYLDNGANIESVETLPWSKKVFIKSGESVGLSARNLSSGEMDAWIMFMGKGSWQMYQRKISETFIMIKGVIYSTL